MLFSKKLKKYHGLSHCFFNRTGGQSKGIFKSLNCGEGSLDNKQNIKKNIKLACNKLNNSYKKLILLNQIHSNKFHYIKNISSLKKKKLIGDALITKQPKIILGILSADCAPVIIWDRKLKIISAIHAGWRGAYKGIIKKVVSHLYKMGSRPGDLIAVIGPCISQKNYEVKNDFKRKFLKKTKKNMIYFKNIKNKSYFSLNKFVYNELASLKIQNIEIIKKDTYNLKNNFFSARRSIHNKHNDYGRNISLIMIN